MLGSVEFEHEPALEADKVDDVVTEHMLAAKLVAEQLAVAQAGPELLFGSGLVSAKLTSVLGEASSVVSRHGKSPQDWHECSMCS